MRNRKPSWVVWTSAALTVALLRLKRLWTRGLRGFMYIENQESVVTMVEIGLTPESDFLILNVSLSFSVL
jgi:hypothetical protein